MSGCCAATKCRDTAACAPKLEDSAKGPGRVSSAQRTRVAASTLSSHWLMAAAAALSWANSAGVSDSCGAPSRAASLLSRMVRAEVLMASILELAHAPQEITKSFVLMPFRGIPADERIQRGDDGGFVDVV